MTLTLEPNAEELLARVQNPDEIDPIGDDDGGDDDGDDTPDNVDPEIQDRAL